MVAENSAIKLRENLSEFTKPLPFIQEKESFQTKKVELIRMGFPLKRSETTKSLCVCHNKITKGGYICPQCNSKYCELPIDCSICGLKLIASPHLARSYHHLFPTPNFLEVSDQQLENEYKNNEKIEKVSIFQDFIKKNNLNPINENEKDLQFWHCFGCQKPLEKGGDIKLMCPKCKNIFCVECDIFIHQFLQNCPGCS